MALRNIETIVEKLKEVIPEDRLSTDPAVTIAYTRDSSFAFTGIAPINFIVVLPEKVEEVQEILRIANKMNVKVAIEGTMSNLVGLTIPRFNEHILIDMKRMRELKIDEELQVAIVEPGVTHGLLAREATKKGLKYIGPLAPYSTSVIGNMAYTSMKPGATRYGQDQVLALEVVLPTGDKLYTGTWSSSYLRDSTPFYRHTPLLDLSPLFLFTRGVLGIITKAAIRLYPIQERDEILVIGFNDMKKMNDFARKLQYLYIPSTLLAISSSYVPKLLRIPGVKDVNMSTEIPNHLLIAEIEGPRNQVEANISIVNSMLSIYNGSIVTNLDKEIKKMLSPSLYSPRMLQPFGAMLPSICYAITGDVHRYIEEAMSMIKKKFNVETEYVIYYQYMGLNAYVEIDIHYDPIKADKRKLISILKALSDLKKRHKCASTSNEEFAETGTYYELGLELKKMLDPEGVLNPYRLFRDI